MNRHVIYVSTLSLLCVGGLISVALGESPRHLAQAGGTGVMGGKIPVGQAGCPGLEMRSTDSGMKGVSNGATTGNTSSMGAGAQGGFGQHQVLARARPIREKALRLTSSKPVLQPEQEAWFEAIGKSVIKGLIGN
jgi:hypothetical protein